MYKSINQSDIERILSNHSIEIQHIDSVIGSFNKEIYFINQQYILRSSESDMDAEQERYKRVESLNFVPKIQYVGYLKRENKGLHYILLHMLPGDDFVKSFKELSKDQQIALGKNVSTFMDELHLIKGPSYDIGFYTKAIPNYTGSWKKGHQSYWEILKENIDTIHLHPKSNSLLEYAFTVLHSLANVLSFQSGPVLLHNDLHPKNIISDEGQFSGVIDWECSQFGESDFDLSHFIHWCLYPPEDNLDFEYFLGSLFQTSPICVQAPSLAMRLTIYQIEHEIQQLIWSGGKAEEMRVPRIEKWIDGDVEKLLMRIC